MTPPLARLAALLADGTRATFCMALLDGRAWTAGELARHAGVAASTASEHLTLLVAGGLLAEEHQGRHRYVRLATPRVAELIEEMSVYADAGSPAPPKSLRGAVASEAMARARTCYDHLAGRLGVRVTDAMAARGLLGTESGFAVTERGRVWLESEVGATLGSGGRRPLVRACLDWTERRPHLAGAAGAALCQRLHERGWVVRIGSQRAVRVTPAGEAGLRELLGLTPADLA
ncbi:ArsR/SmtB family transcription factor [Phytohabitans houttuyneae]|uniref:Transcriptional regulator n=1 Tax=Phytohabitans houttuyneae TaxID=1076126 RepID=A0A6V8K9S0_9ACTN|nr:helix-turn-helix domain-containing protein [Phytohabitans houttuyneae]GFJ79108.1 transcriptional regulator [Phytohabitans houttuyneae]